MITKTTHNDAAVERAIATIDNAVADLYPNHTCFIAAANPEHGVMVTRELFEGKPVALIFDDGHEILFTPEDHPLGPLGNALLRLQLMGLRRKGSNVLQLPPNTRIEAREFSRMPAAA